MINPSVFLYLFNKAEKGMQSIINQLLSLIRIALGSQESFSLSMNVEWEKVIQSAMSFGLDALAFDGLQAVYERQPELTEALDNTLGETRFEWLGYTLKAEQDYELYRKKLRGLAAFYQAEGLRLLVLKGYGLSIDYPIPSHRPTGDIDIYLYGRGKDADDLVQEKLGVSVKLNEDKHSTFSYRGLSVENHAHFLNVHEHRSLRGVESFLKEEALRAKVVSLDGVNVYVPTPLMNAVFLPYHMISHFVYGGISMKQLVDWAVFLKRNGRIVNWSVVREVIEKAGCFELFRALNGLAVKHLYVEVECVPNYGWDDALAERIWQDTLLPHKDIASRSVWVKLKDFWALRWKYKLAYRESYFLTFFRHGWASIRGKYLPHSRSVWKTRNS